MGTNIAQPAHSPGTMQHFQMLAILAVYGPRNKVNQYGWTLSI
jgi:hypothetical protein